MSRHKWQILLLEICRREMRKVNRLIEEAIERGRSEP
jgi:hypothetical protein